MTSPEEFAYDVFLSHSSKDKAEILPLAERLRADGLAVWLDDWEIKAGDSIPAKIEEGLERSRVLLLCMSAKAFGSDWAQLEAGTFRFRDPLNKERRFIPLRLDDAPVKGTLAQFLSINWNQREREQEYAKILEACRNPELWPSPAQKTVGASSTPHSRKLLKPLGRLSTVLACIAALALVAASWGFRLNSSGRPTHETGPALKVVDSGSVVPHPFDPQRVANRLLNGYVPKIAIRLIPYQDFQNAGGETKAKLGSPEKQFVFVCDYDEFRGRSIMDAVSLMGIALSVSDVKKFEDCVAVIFPYDENTNINADIRPGTARTFLKRMNSLHRDNKNDPGRRSYEEFIKEDANVKRNLDDPSTESYALKNWWDLRDKFTTLVAIAGIDSQFERDFSRVDSDWRPLGYATDRKSRGQNFMINDEVYKDYGALVFLAHNEAVTDLKGRIVLRLTSNDRIPELKLE